MKGLDPTGTFDALLDEFAVNSSDLDRAILQHSIDGWPMAKLAKRHGTTPAALHRRKRELLAMFHDYLLSRGISRTADVFDR